MASQSDRLLVVGFDLDVQAEVHIGDRPMEQWRAAGYNGTQTVVCYLCWHGVDAEPMTRVPLVPRGRVGGQKRAHFAHPPGFGVHDSAAARETMWHLGTKHQIARWAASRPNVVSAIPERWTPDRKRRADVAVLLDSGSRLALEVQSRIITDHLWQARHEDYAANGVRDAWFMHPTAEVPYILFERGVQAFTIHGGEIAVPLGQPHDRTADWWNGDLGKLAQHYPPCAGDRIQPMRFALETLGLDSSGIVLPAAVAERVAADRLRVERDAMAARHRAELQAAARSRATSRVRVVKPETSTVPRQQRIEELRQTIRRKSRMGEAQADSLPDAVRLFAEPPSWVPSPAFTVDLACVHCKGRMGVLTAWPDFMGVPRSKHPLQCTACWRLSGAPCPCPECR